MIVLSADIFCDLLITFENILDPEQVDTLLDLVSGLFWIQTV